MEYRVLAWLCAFHTGSPKLLAAAPGGWFLARRWQKDSKIDGILIESLPPFNIFSAWYNACSTKHKTKPSWRPCDQSCAWIAEGASQLVAPDCVHT